MLRLIFIRHGMTYGNVLKRYIGVTNELITNEAKQELQMLKNSGIYENPDVIYVSPMRRCIQTSDIIYPTHILCKYLIQGFKECDFGDFENKNYMELVENENTDYQKWIDSNGENTFPNGENPKEFRERCVKAFEKIIAKYVVEGDFDKCKYIKDDITIAFVVHGGTIMALFEQFEESQKPFYEWQIKNGHGYIVEYTNKKMFHIISEI